MQHSGINIYIYTTILLKSILTISINVAKFFSTRVFVNARSRYFQLKFTRTPELVWKSYTYIAIRTRHASNTRIYIYTFVVKKFEIHNRSTFYRRQILLRYQRSLTMKSSESLFAIQEKRFGFFYILYRNIPIYIRYIVCFLFFFFSLSFFLSFYIQKNSAKQLRVVLSN